MVTSFQSFFKEMDGFLSFTNFPAWQVQEAQLQKNHEAVKLRQGWKIKAGGWGNLNLSFHLPQLWRGSCPGNAKCVSACGAGEAATWALCALKSMFFLAQGAHQK